VKRAALLSAAVIAYMIAAWMVAPGFYDGFGPVQPYSWTCPPPQAGSNVKPSSGHLDVKVIGGVSDPDSAYPNKDAQIVIGFLPGAFDATGKTTIAVDITPLPTCPQPPGIHFVTNIYEITASAPLVKASNLVLLYSNLEPAPTDVYFASDPGGPWKSIGAAQQSQPYTIDTSTKSFGYFAAGYPSASPPPGAVTVGGGSQTLPIVVAVLIVLVVLAGLPLALMRRRRSHARAEEEDEV
jgi:hypothetical protein